MKILIAILTVVVIAPLVALFALSGGSEVRIDAGVTVVGQSTPVLVKVENTHGIRQIMAVLEQNGQRATVFEQQFPATRFFWSRKETPKEFRFAAGKQQAAFLKDGSKAKLTVEVKSNDFSARSDTAAREVDVITAPPLVTADGSQHYINQGGMELVTFTVSGYAPESGVRVGKYTFRSFRMPGKGENERFAMFAYPWDLGPGVTPVVYARNPAGNEAIAHFWFKLFPKKFRKRELPIPDSFLQKVVDQIEPSGQGSLLDRFLKINGEMRRKNNQTLADQRLKTESKFLWHGAFVHWGQEESMFADVRSYMYNGKKVDEQVHLGFDLADRANSPVRAVNDGKVVWAENLGIYGNCIVVDHGYGLQSIYGHMSSFAVKVGDMVKKEQELGKSGATGLAGGDHLHLSMQIDGVQINPVEWWDEHWIKDRILSKVSQ